MLFPSRKIKHSSASLYHMDFRQYNLTKSLIHLQLTAASLFLLFYKIHFSYGSKLDQHADGPCGFTDFLLLFLPGQSTKKEPKTEKDSFNTRPLQLQAYERLVMLAERIAIPNLISRVNQPGLSAREMQLLLLESIKQEVEYNATQQIYVSPVAWEAVRNLKDQNMLIINQVAATLASEATSTDLNKMLLDFVITQKKGALHSIVLEALNYEAKKIMK